jgi:hypothetical protein
MMAEARKWRAFAAIPRINEADKAGRRRRTFDSKYRELL